MIEQKDLYKLWKENGIEFFTGVPDSYLNGFCNFLLNNIDNNHHVIAANEGNAIGIAAGHYFATGEVPVVYMQNSGIGNAINPLASLADENVYGVPMILVIGWRGPGEAKHPQHKLQGEITTKLLEIMNIPYNILEGELQDIEYIVKKAVDTARNTRKPYGLIVPKGILDGEKGNNKDFNYPLSREEAIEVVLDHMPEDTVYCTTTGRATRELYFLREKRGESKENDFLNVGAMGHNSSVALGIALESKQRKVVVLDGDSAAIMHMGAMTTISKYNLKNYIHIILNNGAHESVGGQPSAGHLIDFTAIAKACGYKTWKKPIEDKEELIEAIEQLGNEDSPVFLDVRIHKGLRGVLPPLDFEHRDAIDLFMDKCKKSRKGE